MKRIIAMIVAIILCVCVSACAEGLYMRVERGYVDANGLGFSVIEVLPMDGTGFRTDDVDGTLTSVYIAIVDDPNAATWDVYYTHTHNYVELVFTPEEHT